MPAASRVGQSLGVYYHKLVNGWPLVLRHSLTLLWHLRPRIIRRMD